ncbi:MAG: hypothetical protein ACMUHX_10495 [bacterium]
MSNRLKFISLPILSFIILFWPHISASEVVNEKIALTGALYNAQEAFGPLVHFNTQLFVDLDDVPQAYVFILCNPQNPVLNMVVTDDEILSGFLSDYEKFGIVTAVAGANKSHVPVIQMYRGLPDYIINSIKIKKTITEKTSKENWKVMRYLYPAPLELWLEFKNPNSNDILFVRTSDMEIMDSDLMEELRYSTRRARTFNSDRERSERIKKKWDFVENLHINQTSERFDRLRK